MNPPNHNKIILPAIFVGVFVIASIGFGINAFISKEEISSSDIDKKTSTSKPEVALSTQAEKADIAISAEPTKSKDEGEFIVTTEERLQLLSSTRDLNAYDEDSISSAINDPRIWDFSTEASPDGLPLDDTEKQDGRAFFNANPARVAVSLPGDVLEIALPNSDEPLLLDVEQAAVLENGLVSLSGSIQGDNGTFNVTQSNVITAGHINTSTDTYSFEVFGNTGWIHQSGALFTGELPPVIDDFVTVVDSTLGNQGEQIFAKGNNQSEKADTPTTNPIDE